MGDAKARPWGVPTPEDEAEHGSYAEFVRWEKWMWCYLDEPLDSIAEDGLMDAMNGTQKAYLFNLMGRLADGRCP